MKRFEEITFDTPPTMLAAWPGMGNVGLIAMDYIRKTLNARVFAEIDMSPFFIPESIIVKDGLTQFPEIPSSIFHYVQNPNLIIFESNAQIGGRDGISIIKTILDIAQRLKVQRVFTAAAFSEAMSYQSPTKVLAACNTIAMQGFLRDQEITPMPDGYIAGLNGLMLGVAASRQIDAGCLLGTIPSYATNISYPKGSLEIIKRISGILKIKIDLTELESDVAEMDEQLAAIEERIKEYFTASSEQHDEEIAALDEEKVPHYIMEKIERLFDQVKVDKSQGPELKKELDRWNLFELYENRFLDLFKDDNEKGQGQQNPDADL